MALSKSQIKKLEKHINNYVILWVSATAAGSILRYMPELKNYRIPNPKMPGSELYLYNVQNKYIIKAINAIDDNLDIYKVTGNNLTYDEIKSVIEDGINLVDVKGEKPTSIINKTANKVINFKHIEINDL